MQKKTDKVAEYCRQSYGRKQTRLRNIADMKILEKKEENRQNCGVIQTKLRKMIDMVRKKTDIYEGNNTDTEENRHKIRKYSW